MPHIHHTNGTSLKVTSTNQIIHKNRDPLVFPDGKVLHADTNVEKAY
jgi:hypothetical protein